ncbi:hypothetical protein KFK09_004650 [Dendrobium nobile]|uniref:Uncharacterized protein n=1 Tax=Dendrobium nobile TaxID=94219 RepID=A0A8T3C6B8_DENNO|nr:hypothetical protein KFK09_004650 [Dendrobium nobile]
MKPPAPILGFPPLILSIKGLSAIKVWDSNSKLLPPKPLESEIYFSFLNYSLSL